MAAKKFKILLIDDEKDFCFFIKSNLELQGKYNVVIASNGRKGIWAAMWHKPDLIFLDIMMPGMDGLEVLKKIKGYERTMAIPVIMLTARDEDVMKIKAAGLYDEDYMVKPVQINELRARIEKTLAKFGKSV